MEEDRYSPDFITLDDEKYEFSKFCDLIFPFKFDLPSKKVAVARFGGPIAIYKDFTQKTLYNVNDQFKDHICFYSNEGLFLNKCQFQTNDKIVGFDFIYDELLVVVLEKGIFYLIDPFEQDSISKRKEEKRFNLSSDDDLIVEAKIIKNGIGFFTKSNRFYHMDNVNVSQPQLSEYANPGIQTEIQSWTIVPHCDYSDDDVDRFDIYVANSQQNGGGVIRLSESQPQVKNLYNGQNSLLFDQDKILNLKNVKSIASNNNGQMIAFLAQEYNNNLEEWVVHIVSEEKDEYKRVVVEDIETVYANECERVVKEAPPTIKSLINAPTAALNTGPNQMNSSQKSTLYNSLKAKINMLWVDDSCVAIEIRNTLFLVGSKSSIQPRFNNDLEFNIPSFFCLQEIDGVKIIAENRIYMLRKTNQAYLNIFEDEYSQSPGALLYEKQQNFQNENQDMQAQEDILNNQNQLQEAVNDCIEAGAYEFNIQRQQALLKSASHGRILLQGFQSTERQKQEENEDDDYSLTRVCKLLRVAQQLNSQQKYTRSITFTQMKYLDEHDQILLKIMLRYNYHYIAIEVSKFLRLDIKNEIYVHWACCKIEKKEADENIIKDIKNQLKDQKDIPYTEIAYKALQMGKPKIVLELLNLEPFIQKRIPVLLSMAKKKESYESEDYFNRALYQALQSKVSNLIYLVIKTIWDKEKDKDKTFDYFMKDEILSTHFQRFLKTAEFDQLNQSQKINQQLQQYVFLQKFYDKQKLYQKAGFSFLQMANIQQDFQKKVELLKSARSAFSRDQGDKFYALMIDEQQKLLMNSQDQVPTNSKENTPIVNMSVNQRLQYHLQQNQERAREKLQGEVKLHSKTLAINKLKILIDQATAKDYDVERFVEETNRKSEVIPYWIIIDQLLKKGIEEIAFNIAMKIRNDQQREEQYLRIINQSFFNEKKDLLDSMYHRITSPEIKEKIQGYLHIFQGQPN